MPRRAIPDPTARAVGQRIRALRGERQLTAERLAFESELGSKGYLSDIEQGLARPSLTMLAVIADYLEVLLVDLFTFPEDSERQQLIDRTRWLTPGAIRKLLREMPIGPARGARSGATPEPRAAGGAGPAKARRYESGEGEPKKMNVAEPTALGAGRKKPAAKTRGRSIK